jgi:general secretion pathway protein G
MKKSFTMIELIFVIVILGIIGSIAVKKLNATRDDAKIAKLSMNLSTSLMEISTYAAAKGETDSNLSIMSAVIANLENGGEADTSTADEAKIKVGEDNDCVIVRVKSGDGEKNVSIDVDEDSSDTMCKTLQKVIKDQNYSMRISGKTIDY